MNYILRINCSPPRARYDVFFARCSISGTRPVPVSPDVAQASSGLMQDGEQPGGGTVTEAFAARRGVVRVAVNVIQVTTVTGICFKLSKFALWKRIRSLAASRRNLSCCCKGPVATSC